MKKRTHYIYKITNLLNGKMYIGQRLVPKNMDIEKDKYLGSGNLIIAAVKKYGKSNFKKEILEICNSRKKADELENYYFEKLNVLGDKEKFYNRGRAGQEWREKGHSEFISNTMKDFYSKQENRDKVFIGKYGVTEKEYKKIKEKKEAEKISKKYNRKIEVINKKINKIKYIYFRKLTSDLRKEYKSARAKMIQKEIWKTKRHDKEWLEKVRKGKKNVDYKKVCKKGKRGKNSKKRTFTSKKHNSIIYDSMSGFEISVGDLTCKKQIETYLSIGYKKLGGLERALKNIVSVLKSENIKIDYNDLLLEAKQKYKWLYK